ncbi:VOC family protein [Paracoccus sp. R12_1]|uniref:VOC family protein n=1 Tax=unclassified Paracoccus (in: a-proteobacteria) TaxID=2688777 RepID=UPI001ADC8BAD|nr:MULTISPECIES: VOC family protein [unclassified Paracoccus (in: a-proteobacteria)]MBO9456094.1 VOC family protein [Paracoccus sp. R12_2]MBO9487089.1 VOC family protein [Paracoccus sp. R12_1]
MSVLRIVPARDPARLAKWYRELLGLDVAMDHGFIVTLGGQSQVTQLSLASQGGSGTDLPVISIEVDDLEAVTARAGDAIVYGPADEPWGVRRIYLRDPEGNLVNVLCHAGQGQG